MPTNGKTFVKDERTGYLTPQHHGSLTVFGSESKERFIKLFEECGDLSKACDTLGVNYSTMRDHVKLDEAFARDLNTTLSRMEQRLTGTMYKKALEPNGTMDRFGWLRAHNPQKWNPKTNVVVSQDNSNMEQLFSSLKESGQLIDAELSVDNPVDKSDSPS